ncbi:MAG: hypothetical protein GY724_26120, partial [Actinomycetia bacterium]|nr:hypothetical protein [Actinomycetes bacterium]
MMTDLASLSTGPAWGSPPVDADNKGYNRLFTMWRTARFVTAMAAAWWWLTFAPVATVSLLFAVSLVVADVSWLVTVLAVGTVMTPTGVMVLAGRAARCRA